MVQKLSKLEKLKPFVKVLDFWFVPSSFVRYVQKLNKDIEPNYKSDTVILEYITTGVFELIRIGAYFSLAWEHLLKPPT